MPWSDVPLVAAACFAGSLLESALATAFEGRGIVGSNVLNLLNTASSAAAALMLSAA
jgi:uncharacterized membrane protein